MCLTEYNEAETMQMFKEEGFVMGADYRDKEKITDMLRRGKTVEEIVDFCDYPYEQVKEIADALEAQAEVKNMCLTEYDEADLRQKSVFTL